MFDLHFNLVSGEGHKGLAASDRKVQSPDKSSILQILSFRKKGERPMTRLMTICSILAIAMAINTVGYGDTGSISGTVTDTNGSPIAGLKVLVFEIPPKDKAELTSADTNLNGGYTVSGLATGDYMVGACPGRTGLYYINKIYRNTTHYNEANAVTVNAPDEKSDVNFQLEPSGAITGRVMDTLNKPIPGLWIEAENCCDEYGMFQDTQTDANGNYVITGLPPAGYKVRTNAGESGLNYADVFYPNVTSRYLAGNVWLNGTETRTGIDFSLNQGGAIRGTVTDSHGQPIGELWVEALDYTTGMFANGTQTEANGVYNLAGLSTGSYRVHACASCGESGFVDKFYDGKTSWDLANPVTVVAPGTTTGINFTLAAGTSISGHVYGWDSNTNGYIALAGANINAENALTNFGCGWAQSEANGSYTLSGLEPGSYRVRAERAPYKQQYYPNAMDWSQAQVFDVNIEMPRTGINFQLDLGGAITGTVTDQDTHLPITNAFVNASPTNGEPWGCGTNMIGNDGSFTISGLPAGRYKVRAQAAGYDEELYSEKTDWMEANEVNVAVGQTVNNVNFTLRKETGGTITGQVVLSDGSPVAFAHVNANSMDNMKWKNGDSDTNGNFAVSGITVGQWRLRAQPPFGPDYINVSESDENIITMPDGTPELNVGHVKLPTVSLVGQVLMPDGSPASWTPVNIETSDWSFFVPTQTDQGGYFRKGGLSAGTYTIKLQVPWGRSGIVPPDPCIVEINDPNVVLNIGVITYATAAKHITGLVQREDQTGIAGVQVNACKRGGDGWANTQTGNDGAFHLDVASGTWEVMIHPGPQQSDVDWVYTGYPEVVTFEDNPQEETKTITFTVKSASSRITGRVIGPGGETLRQGAGWIDVRDDSGRGNGMPLDSGGQFSVSVSAGTYNVWVGVDQRTYPYWSSPRLSPVKVEDGQTANLGDIQLVTKTAGVQGRVTRSGDGMPISGVSVHAWQREGGWADSTTNDQGDYRLSLIAGTWDICAELPYNSSYVSDRQPRTVVVSDNNTISGVDFLLQQANGSIALSLYDSDGNLLTQLNGGWAYARENGFSMKPTTGGPINNGQCTMKVPGGTYLVGINLPPNSGYTMSGEREVTVTESQVDVNIPLLGNNSIISGTFYTDANKTTPATGIQGEVFAMQKMGGVWQSTPIDSNSSYQLRVAAGEWNLGYWIRSSGYINNPPPDSGVTVGANDTNNYDFVLVGADATIRGTVLDPDGNPLNHAWVWAHSEGNGSPGSRIDNGSDTREPDASFTINVPSGREYEVGSNAPGEWGYIQPDFNRVTPAQGGTVTVTLQYKRSDASVTGRVYYKNGDTEVPCEWAWVNAWSDNGQHTGTGANDQGQFQLNVTGGTIWHLEAMYHPREESTFYKSARPTNVSMTSSMATANLELQLADRELPPAVSATFDPNVGWTNTLEDGTRIEIPAGAIPADDNVCISFTPIVDELRTTATDKPIGWGYAISISEQSTGSSITDNFNTNVLLTFAYRDEDLNSAGLTEDDISPAYYSTTTNSWTKVESFTVDKDNNTITVQINHFSTWALTGGPKAESEEQVQTVEMTITKCAVKAGKTQGQDSLDASGTFAELPADLNDVTHLDVNVVSLTDGNQIYRESIDFSPSQVTKGKFKYAYKIPKGADGAITSLAIDLNKKTFAMRAQNIDLTGLACPMKLNVSMGNCILSGQASENIVNNSKTIPTRLMRTYKDTLVVSKASAKDNTKSASDSFSVKGDIAVADISVDLASEDVVISWGDQTFTIPAGSFTAKTGKSYKCSKVNAQGESGLVTAAIDLDKCTFSISIKGADLDVASGDVVFGVNFADFDETAGLNLP
jgi:hypothetical protein